MDGITLIHDQIENVGGTDRHADTPRYVFLWYPGNVSQQISTPVLSIRKKGGGWVVVKGGEGMRQRKHWRKVVCMLG